MTRANPAHPTEAGVYAVMDSVTASMMAYGAKRSPEGLAVDQYINISYLCVHALAAGLMGIARHEPNPEFSKMLKDYADKLHHAKVDNDNA